LGYSNEDIQNALKGKGEHQQFFHDEYLSAIDQYYKEILDLPDGEKKELIYRIRDKTGNWQWMRKISSVFYRDENGAPTQVLNSFENITEQKENESRIFESEARNRALIEAVPGHIFRINSAGEFIDCKIGPTEIDIFNPKTRTRGSFDQITSMNLDEMLPPDYLSSFKHHLSKLLETGQYQYLGFDFYIDGQLRSFEISLVAVVLMRSLR